MNRDELKDLFAICKEYDVTVFSDGNVHIAFGPNGKPLPVPATSAGQLVPVPKGKRKMTDMERFLFSATEGYVAEDDEAVVEVEAK